MSSRQRVPRLIRLLTHLVVPRAEREYFLGDLEESISSEDPGGSTPRRRHSTLREIAGAIQLLAGRRPIHAKPPIPRGNNNMLHELAHDIRFGLRMMARTPGFTAIATITMALGIGINTAMFSVVNGVLLRPLPYPEAERIVYLRENNLPRGWASFSIAPDNFRDWEDQNRSMELVAAYRPGTVTYVGGDRPRRLSTYRISEGFLDITGGDPALGREFVEEDMDPGREGVVLLDHGFWERSFGGNPQVLGTSMILDGERHVIVGILPQEWRYPLSRQNADVFLPLRAESWWGRGSHFLYSIARMKPGVTVEQAQSDLSAVAAALEAEYPETNAGWGVSVRPLDDAFLGQARPQLLILLASVGLVLLIACVNVAQMTLARGTARGHEMAIRTALGAGRGRIVRQLVAESLLLSLLGGALGVLLAAGCLEGLSLGWPRILPRTEEIGLHGTVLLFTIVLSVTSGLLFGLFPALSLARSTIHEALRRSGWSVTGDSSRRRLRSGMVVVEVGLAVILLVGSGLLIRSFLALQREDPGFDAVGRMTFYTPLSEADYPTADDRRAYAEAMLPRVAAVPGVEAAAVTTLVPVSGSDEIWGLELEERPPQGPDDAISALLYRVSAGYFDIMGIPLIAGRDLTWDDRYGTEWVAVVSESFAQTHSPGESPVGKRIRFGGDESPFVEIVGVVGSVQHYDVGRDAMPQVYLPFAQWPDQDVNFVVKASVTPLSLVNAIRTEVQGIDPHMPLEAVQTLDQIIAGDMSAPRFRTTLLTAFGLTALLLAVVGLYGVMSYTVSQRSREIGMRMALGAQQSSILRLVLRDGVPLVATGVVAGLAGALALTRVLESMLFGVGARDAGVFVTVPLLLVAVSAAAMLVPAVRAMRVDPVKTLAPE